jgi:hypothetical protein
MTPPKIVRIRWLDICTSNDWESADKGAELSPADCVTVGYLLKETPDVIVVASTWTFFEDEAHTNCRTSIPRGCVVSMEDVG